MYAYVQIHYMHVCITHTETHTWEKEISGILKHGNWNHNVTSPYYCVWKTDKKTKNSKYLQKKDQISGGNLNRYNTDVPWEIKNGVVIVV